VRVMEHDWLLASIDAMEVAAAAAREAMEAVVDSLDGVRSSCSKSVPLVEIVDELIESGSMELRSSAELAIQRYERAVLDFRSKLVKHMTEDEGMTIADAARHMRISPQRAGRLLVTTIEGSERSESPGVYGQDFFGNRTKVPKRTREVRADS